MNRTQAKRAMKVYNLIGELWGEDHFNLDVEQKGDLGRAFKEKKTGCGAAGCVSGFLPLVTKLIGYDGLDFFLSDEEETFCVGMDYINIAMHKRGFGFAHEEAEWICAPSEYYNTNTGNWTRASVRRRIRSVVARYHPDIAATGNKMERSP